jgi:hypothetical protein
MDVWRSELSVFVFAKTANMVSGTVIRGTPNTPKHDW